MRTNVFLSIMFLVITAGPLSALAEPGIVYRYGPKLDIIGVNAIVDLERAYTEKGDSCEQRIADLVIDEVVYEGANEIVIGFRAKLPGNNTNELYGLFTMDTTSLYKKLSNSERRNVQLLVKKGAEVVVTYQICGSGGFISVRDIYAKSAVNNP